MAHGVYYRTVLDGDSDNDDNVDDDDDDDDDDDHINIAYWRDNLFLLKLYT